MLQEITSRPVPLPPEIGFDATSATFHGTTTPGTSVRITSSADVQMHSAMSDEDGNWKIALGGSQGLYTIFEIWACDPKTGSSSAKVQFVFGGSQPRLADVYASENLAFGEVTGGNEISVYGPDGSLIGRDFVIGDSGSWAVKYRTRLNAGDKVCVIARRLTGATSMPFFTSAKVFSVDVRNVAHIAGSGAKPGEQVQLIHRTTGEFLAKTRATDLGTWSTSFCKLLEPGTPIAIRRTDKSGITTEGPYFSAMTARTLVPVITYVGELDIAGVAAAGLHVTHSLYRSGVYFGSETVVVDKDGNWQSAGRHDSVKKGDLIVAKSSNAEGTSGSLLYSAIVVGEARPGAPDINSIDGNGASGTGEAGKLVVISTAEVGIITSCTVDDNNQWSVDWRPYVGSLSKDTCVYFVQYDALQNGSYSPTSVFTARYADADADPIPAPTIEGQTEDGAIYGTETDVNTTVLVFDNDTQVAIADRPAPVKSDTTWVLAPDDALTNGEVVYAQATGKDPNGPGATSPLSNLYTVQAAPIEGVPCPPEIQNAATPYIWGSAQKDTWVTLTVQEPGKSAQTFGPVATTETFNWHFDLTSEFGTSFDQLTRVSATAQYGQNATQTSDAYVKVVGRSTLGPATINTVTTTQVTGVSPVKNMIVQAWRGSDGKQIVYYKMPGSDTSFTAQYDNGQQLGEDDLLWLVCGYEDNGTMTPYDRKPEGYSSS